MRAGICLFINTVNSHHRHHTGNRNSIYVHFQFIHSYWRTDMWVSFRLCVLIVQFTGSDEWVCACVQMPNRIQPLSFEFNALCSMQIQTKTQRGRERECEWAWDFINSLHECLSRFLDWFLVFSVFFPLTHNPFVIFRLSVHQNMHISQRNAEAQPKPKISIYAYKRSHTYTHMESERSLWVSCLHVVFMWTLISQLHIVTHEMDAGKKIPERARFYDNLLCGLSSVSPPVGSFLISLTLFLFHLLPSLHHTIVCQISDSHARSLFLPLSFIIGNIACTDTKCNFEISALIIL